MVRNGIKWSSNNHKRSYLKYLKTRIEFYVTKWNRHKIKKTLESDKESLRTLKGGGFRKNRDGMVTVLEQKHYLHLKKKCAIFI
jgi:hypothetical protein